MTRKVKHTICCKLDTSEANRVRKMKRKVETGGTTPQSLKDLSHMWDNKLCQQNRLFLVQFNCMVINKTKELLGHSKHHMISKDRQ